MQKTIILDFGSGVTNNNTLVVEKQIRDIVNTRTNDNKIIIKFQLFNSKSVPGLQQLSHRLFSDAYYIANQHGFECTASVFDLESLQFLMGFNPKSIKIAARKWAYPLIERIPKDIEIFVSVQSIDDAVYLHTTYYDSRLTILNCIAQYPARQEDYEKIYGEQLRVSISDHTTSLDMYNVYEPIYYERHVCSYHDDKVPDRSAYTSMVKELRGVI